ncbi:hypothetical protein [Streptomyces sp. NRRL WC-3742]|uniref:hypothetical protein n=1 Tax=Streptomyces sp. NRRL WC-3742 TaxID=1463934 RepID=UPI0004C88DE6|nr:hypothetical protein [Streptomyces sp. NRRL WC-3742]
MDVDTSAPGRLRVAHHPSTFETRDEAMADLRREVAESPLPRLLRAAAISQLDRDLRGEDRPHDHDVFGGVGVYWAAFTDRAQWRVSLADSSGRVATTSVILDPDQQVDSRTDAGGPVATPDGPHAHAPRGSDDSSTDRSPDDGGAPATGTADGGGAAHSHRIDASKLSRSLQAEGALLKLCAVLGLLFAIGGLKSWLDPSRWELGRVLFLPAVAVLIGCAYWARSIRTRARAYLDREG